MVLPGTLGTTAIWDVRTHLCKGDSNIVRPRSLDNDVAGVHAQQDGDCGYGEEGDGHAHEERHPRLGVQLWVFTWYWHCEK